MGCRSDRRYSSIFWPSPSRGGARKANLELGESVAVIGLRLIGQFALQFARLSGAFPAIGVDMIASRRSLCIDYGAD